MNRYVILIYLVYLCLFANSENLRRKQLVVLYRWTRLEFTFPTEELKQIALQKGLYVPNKGIPVDVDIEYGGLTF